MRCRSIVILAVAVLLACASGCCTLCRHGSAKKEKGQQAVALSDVPAPARATIQRLTEGGHIKKIEKEQKGATAIYDVEAQVRGKDVEYDVDSSGTILTSEESVEYATLPAAVRVAAENYFGSGEGLKASRELEEGKTFYEVEGRKGGAKRTVKLTDSGQIVEEENE